MIRTTKTKTATPRRKVQPVTRRTSANGKLRTGTNIKPAAPKRAAPMFWIERLDLDRNMWVKGERVKDAGTALNVARSNPVHVRFVMRDAKGASMPMDATCATLVVKDGRSYIRPGKGQRLIALDVMEQARKSAEVQQAAQDAALVAIQQAAKRAVRQKRKVVKAEPQPAPVVKPKAERKGVVLAVPTKQQDGIVGLLARAKGEGALAFAMRQAAARVAQ